MLLAQSSPAHTVMIGQTAEAAIGQSSPTMHQYLLTFSWHWHYYPFQQLVNQLQYMRCMHNFLLQDYSSSGWTCLPNVKTLSKHDAHLKLRGK